MSCPELLLPLLAAAVPLWAAALGEMDPIDRDAVMKRWTTEAMDPIAFGSDLGMFGGREGEAGEWFNHLARALAAMSFNSGGVTFAGQHWCRDHTGCSEAVIRTSREAFAGVSPPVGAGR